MEFLVLRPETVLVPTSSGKGRRRTRSRVRYSSRRPSITEAVDNGGGAGRRCKSTSRRGTLVLYVWVGTRTPVYIVRPVVIRSRSPEILGKYTQESQSIGKTVRLL